MAIVLVGYDVKTHEGKYNQLGELTDVHKQVVDNSKNRRKTKQST
jgi:hypothetical protein